MPLERDLRRGDAFSPLVRAEYLYPAGLFLPERDVTSPVYCDIIGSTLLFSRAWLFLMV